jgi:hypothetical protein
MAIKGILVPDSYSVIPSALIDRNNATVQFTLDTFSDSTKENLLFSKTLFLSCLSQYRKVDSVSKTSPDGTEVDGSYFYAPMNSTGEWAQFAGNFIQYLKQGEAVSPIQIDASVGDMVILPSGEVYRITESRSLLRQVVGTKAVWDNYFAYGVSTAAGTNLVKQCYKFVMETMYPGAIEV